MPIMIICFVAAILLVNPVFPQGCKPETGLYVDVTSTESTPPYGCQTSPYPTLSKAIAYVLSGSGGTIILAQQSSPQVFGLSSFAFSQSVSIQGNQQTLEIQGQVKINEGAVFHLSNASLQFNSNVTSPAITLVGSLDLDHVIVTGSTIQWGTMTGALSFTSCVIKNTEKELMTASQFGVQLLITDSLFFNNSATLLLFQPTAPSSNPTFLTLQSTRFLGGNAPSLAFDINQTQFFGIGITGEQDNILTVTNCSWTGFSTTALKLSTWFITADFDHCSFTSNVMGLVVNVGLSQLIIRDSSFLSNLGSALSAPVLGPVDLSYILLLLIIQNCVFQDNGQGIFIGSGSGRANAEIRSTVFTRNGTPGLYGGCLYVGFISCYIADVDFDGCKGNIGPAIHLNMANYTMFSNIQVRNSDGLEGAGLFSNSNFVLILESSLFENLDSAGSIFSASLSNVTFRNTTFQDCFPKKDIIRTDLSVLSCDQLRLSNNTVGGQLISTSGTLTVTNSFFTNNFATYVLLSTGASPVSFTNCIFQMIDPNTLLFLNSNQLTTLDNCWLSGSFLTLFRGMLPRYMFHMTNCEVKDASIGWLFDGTYFKATLTNVAFKNVTIREGSSTPLFSIYLYITNSTFSGVDGELAYLVKSHVYLDTVIVSGYKTYLPTAMLEIWDTKLVLTNIVLQGFTGLQTGSSLFQFNENSVVTLTNCRISDVRQADQLAGLMSITESHLTLTNVVIDNWSGTMFTAKWSSIWLYNSTFTRGGTGSNQMPSPEFDGGLVNGLDVGTFWMENCFVETIGARSGGVMYLNYDVQMPLNELNAFLVVINSTFQNSTATEDGGVFSISDGSASLYNSTFLSSTAGRNGGFFNFLCNPQLTGFNCVYKLTSVSLTQSSAGQNGGAINYNRIQPILSEVTSANNSAGYGSFIAGYPARLGFVNLSDLNFAQDLTLLSVNESSGQQMSTSVCLGLYDLSGKLVRTDNQSTMNIFLDPSLNSSGLLSGQLSYTFSEGLCIISKTITLTDVPGSSVTLYFISDAIDYTHPDPNTGVTPLPTQLTYLLRNCAKGEITKENTCFECPQGTYSFKIGTLFCNTCLTGMDCHGGANSTIQSGYWSPCIESEEIYVCPQSSTCVGGNGTECETGYSGRLCSLCIDGWFAYGRGLCAKCASMLIQILQGSFIFLGVLLYLLFIISRSLAAAKKKQQSNLAVHLRILVNFVQIMMMMNHFNINWHFTVSGYFDGLYTSGNAPITAFFLDCFYTDDREGMKLVYLKLVMISSLPFLMMFISCIIWSIVSLIKRKSMFMTQHNVCSICVLMITFHPLILLSVLKLLTCISMEQGTSWLVADTAIQCWVGEHGKFAITMVIPVLIVWCIGIPLIFYFYFLTHRKRLKEEIVMRRLAFLYSGYNDDSYYWEFVAIARKSFFILVANSLSTSNDNLQSFTGILVLSFFLFLHFAKQPYKSPNLNKLVMYSLIAPVMTLMCGLMVDTYLGSTTSLYCVLLALIYAVNFNYVLRAGNAIFSSGREWLGEKWPRLRKCLCISKRSVEVAEE